MSVPGETPSAVVVIPARGGSQGVPLKNLARVDGITLVGRAVQASLAAPSVAEVIVSTDHDEIAAEARLHGARVVVRPAEIAGSTASSESALLHVLDRVEAGDGGLPAQEIPPVTVLVQCTSPFIDPEDLDTAIRRVTRGEKDVVVAVSETHDFQWRIDDGVATPVGHTTDFRPRRQDRAPHFRETGAFYVMRTDGFRETGRRFFGDVGIQPLAPEWSIEIDEPRDLWLARQLVDQESDAAPVPLDVDALVTDFDGVHTDDHAYVDQDGTEQVRVSRGDGMGVSRLRRTGLPFLILSTETNKVVASRADKLKVQVMHGVEDKATALRAWIAEQDLDPARVAYVGNDVNDLAAMAVVGWPVAVADARPEVKAQARLVLSREGGNGAVREICDRILAARPGEVTAGSAATQTPVVTG
ncbi:acylneuraminate cytidylyltransferase [Promicromonospora sp. MEB111]|uniref:acylneuraminate cytidylyltransferase n=1 Tax=unclassified Promicromonospora TaxID=2647929 RepID=UPI00254AE1FB|nr:acylneuraminate cytidylyltransferase [Promicromonospora sp. MEB111]